MPPGSRKPSRMTREELVTYTPFTHADWDAAHRIGQQHATWWLHREMDRDRFIAPVQKLSLGVDGFSAWLVGCMVDSVRNQIWQPVGVKLGNMGGVGSYVMWCLMSIWTRSARERYRNMAKAMDVGHEDWHESR